MPKLWSHSFYCGRILVPRHGNCNRLDVPASDLDHDRWLIFVGGFGMAYAYLLCVVCCDLVSPYETK